MSWSELEPCPFCGGKPTFKVSLEKDAVVYYIICNNCDCAGLRSYDKEKAYELWNTRHYPPEVKQAVERMKQLKPRYQYQYQYQDIHSRHGYCTCGNSVIEEHKNCHQCGQALDWSE